MSKRRVTKAAAAERLIEGTGSQLSKAQDLQLDLERLAATSTPVTKYMLLGVASKVRQITRDIENELNVWVRNYCGKDEQ